LTTLYDWIMAQKRYLPAWTWMSIAARLADFDSQMREEAFNQAERALPDIYAAIEPHADHGWPIFVQMREASLVLEMRGDLTRAIDLAVRTLTAANRFDRPEDVALRLGAQLLMVRCWLKVDDVGYAPVAIEMADQVATEDADKDWVYWYRMNAAWALWALGRQDEANALLAQVQAAIPPWISSHHRAETQAYIAYRMRRQAEAEALYSEAAGLFEEAGLRYSTVRCHLNRSYCLYELERPDEAIAIASQILPRAEALGNPHYIGLAHCFWGRAALAKADHETALHHITEALRSYDGRGWLRDEATMAVERLEALAGLGRQGDEEWQAGLADAQKRIALLKSTDVHERLQKLL
jgi:tetratricopeptide (TPR) repeat protein